ncbi:MAG TPA: hypothetical protein DHV37_05740 [Erysipelotrichaceae bacterium]|nr:hypothetical protein [Erysipelotrichaceae bacterium]
MALTRKFLSALGIEEAQADEIIETHTSTIASIKSELEGYKADAEKLAETEKKLTKVQKELNDLKEANENKDENEYEAKYNELKQEFDDYKESIKQKEIKDTKSKAFKELLKEANISEKRFDAILKLSDDDIDKIEFDEDGSTVKDKDKVLKAITENWSEYIQSTETKGVNTANPPANTGGVDKKISRAKQIAQQYHDDLYGKIKED